METPSHAGSVLVANDDPQSRDSLRLAFEKEAPEIPLAFVADGCDVVDYLRDEDCPKPSLLLLDRNLPLMDGFQVLQWLSALPEMKPSHVLMLGSSPQPEDEDRAWAMGAEAFLVSPPTFAELCDQVKDMATLLRGQAPSVAPVKEAPCVLDHDQYIFDDEGRLIVMN